MSEPRRDPAIRGRIIRFRWREGPTRGSTHDHTFHEDGTVEWRDADRPGSAEPAKAPERPAYAAVKVGEQVYLVSYLDESGYTLTVALNFGDQQLVGFASSAKEWYPVRGTFELLSK